MYTRLRWDSPRIPGNSARRSAASRPMTLLSNPSDSCRSIKRPICQDKPTSSVHHSGRLNPRGPNLNVDLLDELRIPDGLHNARPRGSAHSPILSHPEGTALDPWQNTNVAVRA